MSKLISGLALSLASTLAATSAVGLAVAGGLAPAGASAGSATAQAQRPHASPTSAIRADVYGVKLVTDNVEAFNLKDAHAQLRCTRALGQSAQQTSVLSVPDNPLIHVAASTSRTDTYKDGETHGVRGVNTIGDIRIGGEIGGVKTPTLVIEGLTTTADAFHTPQGFGHREAFDFASIRLELLEGTPLARHAARGAARAPRPGDRHRLPGHQRGRQRDLQGPPVGHRADPDPGARLDRARQGARHRDRQEGDVGGHGPRDPRRRRRQPTARSRSARPTHGSAPRPRPVSSARAARRWTCRPCRACSTSATSSTSRSRARARSAGRMTYQVPSAGVLGGLVARVTGVTYAHRGSQHAKKDLAKGFSAVRIAHTSGARGRPRDQRHLQLGQDARQGEQAGRGRRSPRASARSPTRASPSPYPASARPSSCPAGPDWSSVSSSRTAGTAPSRSACGCSCSPRRSSSTSRWPTGTSTRADAPQLGPGQQPFNVASRLAALPSRRACATSGNTTL